MKQGRNTAGTLTITGGDTAAVRPIRIPGGEGSGRAEPKPPGKRSHPRPPPKPTPPHRPPPPPPPAPPPGEPAHLLGWTGCNVTRTGKNLLDINAVTSGAVDHNTGEVIPNTNNKVTPLIRCEPNTTYVVSGFERAIRPKYYRSTIEYIGEAASTTSSTFTTPADCHFMRIQGINIAWSGAVNPQLELGSTATDYEPYQGDTYNITFPSPDPGTVYGGTLDVTAGVLTVDRANIASYSGETLPGKWISDRGRLWGFGIDFPRQERKVVYELRPMGVSPMNSLLKNAHAD